MSELWPDYKLLSQQPHVALQHSSPSTTCHLTQYDAYRGTNFTVAPHLLQPLVDLCDHQDNDGNGQLATNTEAVLQALLLSGFQGKGSLINAVPWTINYQDFVAEIRGLDNGKPYCNETFRLVFVRVSVCLS